MARVLKIEIDDAEFDLAAESLGKAHKLVDAGDKDLGVDPQPRVATEDELTEFCIARLRQLVVDIKGPELEAAAKAAIVMPRFEPRVAAKA